ncbi:hypothetical protein [Kitasatospora sp. NBC_01300]|uniref:hypothetical protein n=1 Tax=Kitasatospora sp. NBC_01300 TaxID=2903574 RepID=UPI002F917BE5|nr:hypothetical protein OG556_34900 [Kitasatospora sp. NBC_01300]
MKRFSAVLAGTAALAALTGVQAATAYAATAATGSLAGPVGTTVCGSPGAPNYVTIRACITVNGNQVHASGRATPTSPTWQDQQVSFRLTSTGITSPPFATVTPTVLIPAGGAEVGGITGTVPCGTTVSATFSVEQPGWSPSTATVSTVVTC